MHSNSCKTLNNLAQWDPQYLASLCPLSNTLAMLGDIGMLNTVDPVTLVSNYY